MLNRSIALILLPFLAGCPASSKQSSGPGKPEKGAIALSQDGTGTTESPQDAQPNVPIVFRLEVYHITVPYGAVSQNDTFWKHLNEDSLDVGSYDLMLRNGIRVGSATYDEWPTIKDLLTEHPATASVLATVAPEAKNIELEMQKDIVAQNIFYYDDGNQLKGRGFDRSENIINLSYQRAPRKLGAVRLSLSPMVRSLRKRMQFTEMNKEMEIEYKTPQYFYLNIVTDLPMDSFLVVAPSEEARWETSLGNRFFLKDTPGERCEQLLVILARPFRADQLTDKPSSDGPQGASQGIPGN